MTKVVEQSYWKLVEGQREMFDKVVPEMMAVAKAEFNIDVTYGAVQNGPQGGNFLFIFTHPDGASFGKYIDTYRTNTAWKALSKKYEGVPIDDLVSDIERIHMF